MYSLKNTLHRNLLVTVTLSLTVLLAILFFGIHKLTRDYVSSRLIHDADSVVAGLTLEKNGLWILPRERMSTVYNRVRSGHYYAVVVNNQKIRSRSLFDTDIEVPEIAIGDDHCFTTDGIGREQWLVCLQKVKKKNTTITVWIAEDITSLSSTQLKFFFFAVCSIVFTIVILLLMQYHILQKGFSKLDQVRESVKQMHVMEKDTLLNDMPVEILPLIEEIHRLLNQLRQRVERSRNALGNMAHELKRPLQRYQSYLETLPAEQQKEGEIALGDIHSVIERELKRARIVGTATPGRHTIINEDLSHLIKVLNSIYPEKQIESQCPENLILPYDRDDMLELIGNLLDNACKFATTKVYVSFDVTDKGWQIIVEDDGQGISTDDLSIITERGVRLDESRQGYGLGLSICRDIVASSSGELLFNQSDKGGLKATVILPPVIT